MVKQIAITEHLTVLNTDFCFYYGFWITRQYFYEQKSIVKMTYSLPFVSEHVLPVSAM